MKRWMIGGLLSAMSTAASAQSTDERVERSGAVEVAAVASTQVSTETVIAAAGGEVTGHHQAREAPDDDGDRGTWLVDYRAGSSIRGSGDGAEVGVTAHGRAAAGYDLGLPSELALVEVEADGGVGVRPTLGLRRDVQRSAYTEGGVRGRLMLAYGRHRELRSGGVDTVVSARGTMQDDQTRREYGLAVRSWFRCWLRVEGAPPRCTDYAVFDMIGVTGGTEAVIGTFYPVRWRGVAIGGAYVDVAVGALTNQGRMQIEEDGEVVEEITTEDLPAVQALSWDVGTIRATGGWTIEARTRRSGWITLDGDMSIEDRASLAISGRRGATSLGASGYAARTAWWTSRTDPGAAGFTAGGELWGARRIADLDVDLRVAAGRSFYAALDGTAATTPTLGAQALVSVRRPFAR